MDSTRVVVVGGGLAGLSATIEAVQHGALVTIVEKEERIGGNSAKATSGRCTLMFLSGIVSKLSFQFCCRNQRGWNLHPK